MIAVGLPLLDACQDKSCGFQTFKEFLQLLYGLRSTGSCQEVGNSLKNVAERFGRNSVLALQGAKLVRRFAPLKDIVFATDVKVYRIYSDT